MAYLSIRKGVALDVRGGNYHEIAEEGSRIFKRFLPSRNLPVRLCDRQDRIWLKLVTIKFISLSDSTLGKYS